MTKMQSAEHSNKERRMSWNLITDTVFLQVINHLNAEDLCNVAKVCRRWKRLSQDEYFWKRRFLRDWKVDPTIGRKNGSRSWREEYFRLWKNVPVVETEVLKEHTNQVLHVSFSHNGKFFSTCSKDGYVLVWDAEYPARIRHYSDMKTFSWKYTQFAKFNESDTLLLVSGVHFGTHSNTGEIAVFSLADGMFELQCRVSNRPYDIFGSWYSDTYLISGDLAWLSNLTSTSTLWLNRASQETDSEFTSVMNRMFRFFNRSASSVRGVMVANCCVPPVVPPTPSDPKRRSRTPESDSPATSSRGNPPSHLGLKNNPPSLSRPVDGSGEGRLWAGDPDFQYWRSTNDFRLAPDAVYYSRPQEGESMEEGFDGNELDGDARQKGEDDYARDDIYRQTRSQSMPNAETQRQESQYYWSEGANSSSEDTTDEEEENTEVLDKREKYLIFSTGDGTYTPHQIGFKRIPPFAFNKRIDPGPSLAERVAHQRELQRNPLLQDEENLEADWIEQRCDMVDHVIELHGHIIGMGLSPDHRYLYVNSRPWPPGYRIDHPLDPPQIAQEIDIHVIDLATLRPVGKLLRAHKAYTPNDECFFIFLDVSDDFVASGAEDKHGYIWDRHYGTCIAKFPHQDVVNAVAFSPKDSNMLITASDDFSLKIWRSRSLCESLGIDIKECNVGLETRLKV